MKKGYFFFQKAENRKLGYNVADFMETVELLTDSWHDYLTGNGSIENVVFQTVIYSFIIKKKMKLKNK